MLLDFGFLCLRWGQGEWDGAADQLENSAMDVGGFADSLKLLFSEAHLLPGERFKVFEEVLVAGECDAVSGFLAGILGFRFG